MTQVVLTKFVTNVYIVSRVVSVVPLASGRTKRGGKPIVECYEILGERYRQVVNIEVDRWCQETSTPKGKNLLYSLQIEDSELKTTTGGASYD